MSIQLIADMQKQVEELSAMIKSLRNGEELDQAKKEMTDKISRISLHLESLQGTINSDKENGLLNKNLESFEFSLRTHNVIHGHSDELFQTLPHNLLIVRDLYFYTEESLLTLEHVGPEFIEEIQKFLADNNLPPIQKS